MADMLGIGTQAARTFKTALDVTSHNVANIGTEGYSRQRAEISSISKQTFGPVFGGGGSSVDGVLRIHAEYIQAQLSNSQSSVDRYDQQLQLSRQVEGFLASNSESAQDFMQRFFDTLQEAADNPTSNTARNTVLQQAESFEGHIANLSTSLSETYKQINNQIEGLVTDVNERLQTINAINKQVEIAFDTGSQLPNDLLDQRDQALLELSGLIDIKTYRQENGRIDIHAANGQLPLLSDNVVNPLQTKLGPYKAENRTEIYLNIGDQQQLISERITGGAIGGVLDMRRNMLDTAQNELGLMLNGMVSSVNWQHYQGYDLNDNAGGNFFEPLEANAMAHGLNTGSEDGGNIYVRFNPNSGVSEPPYTNNVSAVSPPANLDDQPATYGEKQTYFDSANDAIGQFVPREYKVSYDGANFKFVDNKTGEDLTADAVEVLPAGSGRYQLDGLEFDFSNVTPGTIDANDSFLIKPHAEILKQFQTSIQDSDQIATRGQSPLDSDNDGDLNDEEPAAAAYGDNVNMANLANLQSKKILYADEEGNASSSILAGHSKMVSNVGLYVRGSEIQFSAQSKVHDQILTQRESISGVSLDEEAANLLRFQQAYEASAQIISTSQTIFQALLGAVRG